jgi:hypothetical protein
MDNTKILVSIFYHLLNYYINLNLFHCFRYNTIGDDYKPIGIRNSIIIKYCSGNTANLTKS